MRVITETKKPFKEWFQSDDSGTTRLLIVEKLTEKCLLLLPNGEDSNWLLQGLSNASTLRPLFESLIAKTPLSNRRDNRGPDISISDSGGSVSDLLVSPEFNVAFQKRTDFPEKGEDRNTALNNIFAPLIGLSSEVRIADTYMAWNLLDDYSGATWLLPSLLRLGATDLKIFTAYTNTFPGKKGSTRFYPIEEQRIMLKDRMEKILMDSGVKQGRVEIYLNGNSSTESHPRYFAFHFNPTGTLYAHSDKGAEVFKNRNFRHTPQIGPWDLKKGKAYSSEVEKSFTEALVCTKEPNKEWLIRWVTS